MKKSAIAALIVAGSLLAGCVGYEVPVDGRRDYRGDRAYDRDHDGTPNRMDRDRDGDGVRNGQDRRPDDPRRN